MKQSNCDGLLDNVFTKTIPMHGRMIHGQRKNGKLFQEPQNYDAHGRVICSNCRPGLGELTDRIQYIQAVDRAGLNKLLLDSLENLPNVRLYFRHKLMGANFNSKVAWFEQQPSSSSEADGINYHSQSQHSQNTPGRPDEVAVKFDLLIGADGAHSATRYHLMKYARVTYQQEYIDTLWCEFRIKPRSSKSPFAMSPNHLHIWPGTSFMFIAIPSLDGSFTCTLFAPSRQFDSLSASPSTELEPFFEKNFPGVCPDLIAPEDLQMQFCGNPHLPLISIKCTPYHYKSSVVILGDAAHAMVPFYGQGMNAGLEDVRVLFDFFDKYGVYEPRLDDANAQETARHVALAEYTAQRTPDAAAINDLALRNYEEMRAGVQSPLYKTRKWIEDRIHLYMPSLGWNTQYSRVSFDNQRYSEVEKAVQRQGRILLGMLGICLVGLGGFAGICIFGSLRMKIMRALGHVTRKLSRRIWQ